MIDKHLLIKYIKNSQFEKVKELYNVYDILSIYKDFSLLTEIRLSTYSENEIRIISTGFITYITERERQILVSNLKKYLSQSQRNLITEEWAVNILYRDLTIYPLLF